MTARVWPSREEWAAKAEHSVRTACYPAQRVSNQPAAWLTAEQLTEAAGLVDQIVKAGRREINRRLRSTGSETERAALLGHRSQLNAAAREARQYLPEVDELAHAWGRILQVSRALGVAAEETRHLDALCCVMWQSRNDAAWEALQAAIDRTVAERNSDAGWAKELKRRARVEAGPTVTIHHI